MTGRRRSQRAADRAHAADRHVPVAGAAAQQVVQEAHVLHQRRIVGAGECADQRVGRHHAANQIVGDRVGDRMPDRLVDHEPPRGVVAHVPARAASSRAAQRLGQRRPQPGGDDRGSDGRTPRSPPRRLQRRRRRMSTAARSAGRCGPRSTDRACTTNSGGAPAAPGTQLVDDAPRQQADQIRVARQPSVDSVEGVRGHRGAADVVQPLEHLHPASGTGQVGGGDQAVVPAADDDDVGLASPVSQGSPRPHRPGAPAPPGDRRRSREAPGAAAADPSTGRVPLPRRAGAGAPRIRRSHGAAAWLRSSCSSATSLLT